MSAGEIVGALGVTVTILLAIFTASVWLARRIGELSSAQESHKTTVADGLRSVENAINKVEAKHESFALQLNGMSRRLERHEVMHENHSRELERLQRTGSAGG